MNWGLVLAAVGAYFMFKPSESDVLDLDALEGLGAVRPRPRRRKSARRRKASRGKGKRHCVKWEYRGQPVPRRVCVKWKTGGTAAQVKRARAHHSRKQRDDYAMWTIREKFRMQDEYAKQGIRYEID